MIVGKLLIINIRSDDSKIIKILKEIFSVIPILFLLFTFWRWYYRIYKSRRKVVESVDSLIK